MKCLGNPQWHVTPGLLILPNLGKLGLVKGEANGISLQLGITQLSVP